MLDVQPRSDSRCIYPLAGFSGHFIKDEGLGRLHQPPGAFETRSACFLPPFLFTTRKSRKQERSAFFAF